MKVLDLFSGIGGFSMGLERAGMETVAFCEIEEYPRKVLKKHWPDVPIYEDVRKLSWSKLAITPDVICGGFPCQPFSTATHGIKIAENMWPYMLRVIKEIRPRIVIVENVQENPIRKAEDDVKKIGYRTTVKCIGAYEAGADHQRNRWWLCAYPYNKSQFSSALNAKVAELPKLCEGVWGSENYARTIRVPNGLPNRMDRLKGLGNAVVPQIPEIIGRAIMEIENASE
jgi:DNA (cytosine-5)-methyltransferase 1